MDIKILQLTTLLTLVLLIPIAAAADEQKEFSEWLKEKQALDAYARTLDNQEDSPEVLLERSRALFKLGRLKEARNLLEGSNAEFKDTDQGQRLILLGRIHRSLGEYERGINLISQAANYFDASEYKKRIQDIPGLRDLFVWTWKKAFWTALTPWSLEDGKRDILCSWADAGLVFDPESKFWKKARTVCRELKKDGGPLPSSPAIPGYTRDVSRLFAYWALRDFENAKEILNELGNKPEDELWQNLNAGLKSNDPKGKNLFASSEDNSTRTDMFFSVFGWQLQELSQKDKWSISYPDQPGWNDYLAKISSMPPQESLDSLLKEYDSSLLAPEVKSALSRMILAYRLILGDYYAIEEDNLPHDLPLCLQMARALARNNPEEIQVDQTRYIPMLREMLLAAGLETGLSGAYSTWADRVQDPAKASLSPQSLDYLENYTRLSQNKNSTSSKETAFLFPDTPAGQSAFLNLARQAYENGNKKVAWEYLQRIRAEKFRTENESELLKAKAGILMDLGREKESLQTYALLLKRDPGAVDPEKRLKLALAAQQKDQWEWADKILKDLWENRQSLSSGLQAEILFWIGEGRQMQGDIEKAKDAYLRVAWEYTEENIWALTAAYRAGQLYEKQGMLEAAQNLYETVLENSDRDSQKKAARQRLDSIQAAKEKQGGQAPLF
ncbi:MAG: tetratricopeptide repeat protein [Desulfonatronovibrionaceae bacterium]